MNATSVDLEKSVVEIKQSNKVLMHKILFVYLSKVDKSTIVVRVLCTKSIKFGGLFQEFDLSGRIV